MRCARSNTRRITSVVVVAFAAVVVAFHPRLFPRSTRMFESTGGQRDRNSALFQFAASSSLLHNRWSSWSWKDLVSQEQNQQVSQPQKKVSSVTSTQRQKKRSVGTILRCAARPYQTNGGSHPSSKDYTTRKTTFATVQVTPSGVVGDYNQYRSTALKSTKDRALSLLTYDVVESLRGGAWSALKDGDLGENFLIGDVDYKFFRVGSRYRISSSVSSSSRADSFITIEITEPIPPCTRLCKLPYIDSKNMAPKERISRCNAFLERLAVDDGVRGWYAKVVSEADPASGASGSLVHVGDKVEALAA